jgi:hypothetical protein
VFKFFKGSVFYQKASIVTPKSFIGSGFSIWGKIAHLVPDVILDRLVLVPDFLVSML